MLSITKIKRTKSKTHKKVIPVQERTGLYLIVEPQPKNCKRFEGRMRYPRGRKGKTQYISLGVFDEKKNDPKQVLNKWEEIKEWSIKNDLTPQLFFENKGLDRTSKNISLKELIDLFSKHYQKTIVERTWISRRNRLKQILDYFGHDLPIKNFEMQNGGRTLVLDMQRHWEATGRYDQAGRLRTLLKQLFNFAMDQALMPEGQNPATRKPMTEGVGHIPKSNPTIDWNEVPEFLNLLHENKSNTSILVQLATQMHLMIGVRSSAVVRMEWNWIDEENQLIRIPASTEGLKRKLKFRNDKNYDHLIPITPEINQILEILRVINGYQKYVFKSPEGKNFIHLSPESINSHIQKLLGQGRLTAHGWRDVLVTAGQEVGRFPRDIILRQIGHTEHKQGSSGAYDNTVFLPERRDFMKWWTKSLVDQGLKIGGVN
ncbi:hypothetical protein [Prochlorococcus sp. MIT 0604]|uniref:tyrosine-type recombinase/integrase n=1 Tax=Prochlorococcus sp. MIT 0604 TaxID=1501268 RepID=UPI0004F8AD02|nr:hypothetical protein [Prochlorococcus sp. MIT 0604]AIQ94728.1 phage integrase family [Prochlorococcus sp. MIT 0604]